MGRLARRPWAIAVLWLSVLLGFGARAAAGQAIAVSGSVVDAASGRPISGVQMTIGPRTAVTDTDGRFEFALPPGRWEIEIRARDYVPRTFTFDVLAGAFAPMVIELIPGQGFEERL